MALLASCHLIAGFDGVVFHEGPPSSGSGGSGGGVGPGGAGGEGGEGAAVARLDGNYHVAQGARLLAVDAATGVLANDEGVPPVAVASAEVMSAFNGDVAVNPDGSFDYAPPFATFFGLDTFHYTLEDALGATDEALVRLVVVPAAAEASDVMAGIGGFVIKGIADADRAGASVSNAGDVNGDGLADLIVGAPQVDAKSLLNAGAAYVVFGKDDGGAVELSAVAAGTGGFLINGASATDYAGGAVSAAGDVNGDGFDDVIVGASRAAPNDVNSGASYVVFGKASTSAIDLADIAAGTGGFVLNGAALSHFSGTAVSSAGDVNADGLADLVVSSPAANLNGDYEGAAYVVFGKTSGEAVELGDVAGEVGFTIEGVGINAASGDALSGAGDLNGDGLADLVLGASQYGASDTGRAYIVFGKTSGDAVALSDVVTGVGGFVIQGALANDELGSAVSGAGDVNGDGLADVVVGAPYSDASAPDAGASYVVFGKTGTAAVELSDLADGNGGFVIHGALQLDLSGSSVGGAGDVDGDGLADVLVGAPSADPHGLGYAGASYVVFGKTGTEMIDLASIASGEGGFVVNGAAVDAFSGSSVSRAGDVNGDGLDDLVIGAPEAAGGTPNSGESYVVFGGDFSAAVTAQGGPDGDVLVAGGGSRMKDVLVGDAGDDTLTSDGGPDVVLGGRGNDRLVVVDDSAFRVIDGGGGDDVLALGTSGMNLDITAIPLLRLSSIETVDLGGQGNNTLTIPLSAVGAVSSVRALTVLGEAGDEVVFVADDVTLGSEVGYTLYRVGPVVLRVANAVDVAMQSPR
jgi:hypothetical protein